MGWPCLTLRRTHPSFTFFSNWSDLAGRCSLLTNSRRFTPPASPQIGPTFPNCSKYCFTSSTVVFTDSPPTKIFFVRVTIC